MSVNFFLIFMFIELRVMSFLKCLFRFFVVIIFFFLKSSNVRIIVEVLLVKYFIFRIFFDGYFEVIWYVRVIGV